MGSRSKSKPRNIPLEKALSALVVELQSLHMVVQALVNLEGKERVQGALNAISGKQHPSGDPK